MKGSVRRNLKSGTFYARVDAGRRPDGRRRQIRLKAQTRKEIDALVAATITEIMRGTNLDPNKITVTELLDLWLEDRRARIEYRTFADYRSKIHHYLKPSIGHLLVSKLTTPHIQDALDTWKRGERFDSKVGGRRNKTLNAPLTILSMAMRYARAKGLCNSNPVELVDRLPNRTPEPPEADADHAATVLGALQGTSLFEAIWTAFNCGFRRGELLALRRRDLDLKNGCFRVREALMFRDGRRDVKTPKTNLGQRTIPLSPYLLNLLQAYLVEQTARLRLFGIVADGQTPLFDNGMGMHWHPDAFGKAYSKAVRKAGLTPLRLGGSRHGFASITRGHVDPLVVKEMMGHESLSTTSKYGRASFEAKLDAAIRVSDELERRLRSSSKE